MKDDKRHLQLVSELDAAERAVPAAGATDGLTPRAGLATALHALGLESSLEGAARHDPLEDEKCLLQVGELARATDKTVRAIHLYESLGLIEPVRRSKGRYRLFSPDSQVRVRWISKLQSMGLSLSEIQGIVLSRNAQPSARLASTELLKVYSAKLREIRERIAEYRALEQELESSVAFLKTCQDACVEHVAVSGCSRCERHQEDPVRVPELVVGAQAGARADGV